MAAVDDLLSEWDGDGFFYQARKMCFDPVAGERLLRTIDHIESAPSSALDAGILIQTIWRMPYHALAYKSRCVANGIEDSVYIAFLERLDEVVGRKIDELLECGLRK